jgi:hypothetical protein
VRRMPGTVRGGGICLRLLSGSLVHCHAAPLFEVSMADWIALTASVIALVTSALVAAQSYWAWRVTRAQVDQLQRDLARLRREVGHNGPPREE